MSRKQIIILLLTIIAALAIRIYFIPAPGYERDIQLFKIWSQTAAENGVVNVYDKTWCDYPPGYLYVLKSIGLVYKIFYPKYAEHTYLFNFLIKFPGILADLLIGMLIFWFLKRRFSFKTAMLGLSAFVFNPVIFFNSAYWGQVDSVAILFAVLSIFALIQNKYRWAWASIAVAIIIKTQMVVFLPILLLLTWKRLGWKCVMSGAIISWLTSLFILLPFFYYHKVDQVIDRVLNAVGEYPFLSMNAYNIWWMIYGMDARWLSDVRLIFNLISYRTLGTLLFLGVVAGVLVYLFKNEKEESSIFFASFLSAFAFFILPTEMHERYIISIYPFLLLASIKNNWTKAIFGLLSITGFYNLFNVLVRTYPQNIPWAAPFCQASPGIMVTSIVNVMVLVACLVVILKSIKIKNIVLSLLIVLAAFSLLYLTKAKKEVFLSSLEPKEVSQQWGKLMKNRSIDGNQLTVNGFIFSKGIGTHANSSIVYILDGRYQFLEGLCGLDDEQNRGNKIEFFIYADDNLIYQSGIIQGVHKPRYFKLPISGVKEIKLVVGDGGDGINCDHADWLVIKVLR